MSAVGPVERSLSRAPAAAPWALLPAWQETLGWPGAGSVSWGMFLDFREVGRRNCTGKKKKRRSQIKHPAWLAEHAGLCRHPGFGWKAPPFPWQLGRGQHEDVPFFFCNLQQEKQSKSSLSGGVSENFGRGNSQVSPWCQLVPSGLLLPGCSILCGLYSNPVITPGCRGLWVGLGGSLTTFAFSQQLQSTQPQSFVLAVNINPLFLCLLSFNFSCSIQPTSFTPISTTIPPFSSSFEGIIFRNNLRTKWKGKKKKKRKMKKTQQQKNKTTSPCYFKAFCSCCFLSAVSGYCKELTRNTSVEAGVVSSFPH